MANKVIKLISLENIFSHKLKSYIYIHLGQKFLLTSARINSNLILVARNNYTIIFVERTKKKKKKNSTKRTRTNFPMHKIAWITLSPEEKIELRTATSGGRNETGREGLRSSSSNEDKRPPAPFRDALTYVSMDLGRVSPLNPHPSARENTARLMICPTRGRGGGWPSLASRAQRRRRWRRRRRKRRKHQPQQNSFATFRSAASFASPRIAYLSIISPKRSDTLPLPASLFLTEGNLRWEDIASRCFNC